MVYPSVIECLLGAGAPKLKRHPAIEVQSMRVAPDHSAVLTVMEHMLKAAGMREEENLDRPEIFFPLPKPSPCKGAA